MATGNVVHAVTSLVDSTGRLALTSADNGEGPPSVGISKLPGHMRAFINEHNIDMNQETQRDKVLNIPA